MTKQQEAIDLINSGQNVFVTGAGGTGKSWIIQHLVNEKTALCAPTGIAALNIGGVTCHSLFGLPVGLTSSNDAHKISNKFRQRFDRSSPIETIIIDEIGTLRADYLDLIDLKLRNVREINEPWGGLQMVVVGDLFQLSPIVSRSEQQWFNREYSSAFPFAARSWDFHTIELDVIHRQTNPMHVQVLESIRRCDHEVNDAIYIITQMASKNHIPGSLRLCCYNRDADIVNSQEYQKIPGDEVTLWAQTRGDWGNDEPVPNCLRLRVGTRVLICANGNGYVNGDRGYVEEITSESLRIRKDDGIIVSVLPNDWEKHDYSQKDGNVKRQVVATFTQFPIRHGWAVSIHKSQGMTLDGVTIDVGRGCFAHGQLYVALSRCRDLERINFVTQPSVTDVRVDSAVNEFYKQKVDT